MLKQRKIVAYNKEKPLAMSSFSMFGSKNFGGSYRISELSPFIPNLSNFRIYPRWVFEPAIRRNQVVDISGLFKINAVVTVLSAFSPRDALLMGYRITQNIMYGNWKWCSLHHKDEKDRTAKGGSLYEYFVVKQISKLGAYGIQTGLSERRDIN